MDHPANPDFLADITAALDWWREAGVDCDFEDDPRTWLAQPEVPTGAAEGRARQASPAKVESPPADRLDPAALPADLAAFRDWWQKDPLLDNGDTGGRIPPQGTPGASLMIVVEEPEPDDRNCLLAGTQGRLLDAVLTAFGLTRETVYLASVLPRHTPAANWPELLEHGFGHVLAHHVALVAPERLLVLGGNILPLLGHELPQRAAVLRQFNREGRSIPVLASRGLPALMQMPRAKQALWKAWLEWTAA